MVSSVECHILSSNEVWVYHVIHTKFHYSHDYTFYLLLKNNLNVNDFILSMMCL